MASVLPKTDSPASSSEPSAEAMVAMGPSPPPSDLDVLDVLDLDVVFFLDLDSFLYVSLFASREVLTTSDLDVDLHCFKESGVFQKLVEI